MGKGPLNAAPGGLAMRATKNSGGSGRRIRAHRLQGILELLDRAPGALPDRIQLRVFWRRLRLVSVLRRSPRRAESDIVTQLIRYTHDVANCADHLPELHNERRTVVGPLFAEDAAL